MVPEKSLGNDQWELVLGESACTDLILTRLFPSEISPSVFAGSHCCFIFCEQTLFSWHLATTVLAKSWEGLVLWLGGATSGEWKKIIMRRKKK